AGLAFRIQPSPVLEAQFAAVDAKAVRLPFSEVSKAMQSGTVQGTEGPWSNLRGQSAAGKPSYVTETNHGVLNYMLVANSEFWTSIPFALRSELENIVLEVTQTVNAEAAAINQREREQLIASGSATLVTLTPEQRQAWRTKMQPVWKSFESQIGADIMRAALTVNRR
ncbi:TRAP transporter substrate-binding protein DctP, partial [Stutzerimonas stutzeri]